MHGVEIGAEVGHNNHGSHYACWRDDFISCQASFKDSQIKYLGMYLYNIFFYSMKFDYEALKVMSDFKKTLIILH